MLGKPPGSFRIGREAADAEPLSLQTRDSRDSRERMVRAGKGSRTIDAKRAGMSECAHGMDRRCRSCCQIDSAVEKRAPWQRA